MTRGPAATRRTTIVAAGALASLLLVACGGAKPDHAKPAAGCPYGPSDARAEELAKPGRTLLEVVAPADGSRSVIAAIDGAPAAPVAAADDEAFFVVGSEGGSPTEMGDASLVAVDLCGGAILWRTVAGNFVPAAAPLVYDDVVVLSAKGEVVGFDHATGAERWRVGEIADIDVHVVRRDDGVIVAGASGGSGVVYRLDPVTGGVAWRTQMPSAVAVGELGSPAPVTRTPEADEPVVLARGAGGVVALAPGDGRELWRYEIPGAVDPMPAFVAGDVAIVNVRGSGDRLVALELESGEERWSLDSPGVYGFAVTDGAVFVGESDATVRALDPATGAERWRHDLGVLGAGALFAVGDAVLATGYDEGDRGVLVALDRDTGEELWTAPLASQPYLLLPDLGRSLVVVPAVDGLVALDLETGAVRWQSGGGGQPAGALLHGDAILQASYRQGTLEPTHGVAQLALLHALAPDAAAEPFTLSVRVRPLGWDPVLEQAYPSSELVAADRTIAQVEIPAEQFVEIEAWLGDEYGEGACREIVQAAAGELASVELVLTPPGDCVATKSTPPGAPAAEPLLVEVVDPQTGEATGEIAVPGMPPAFPYTVGDLLVLAEPFSGQIAALDASSGEERWRATVPGFYPVASTADGSQIVGPAADNSSVVWLGAADGGERLAVTFARESGGPVAVAGDVVVATPRADGLRSRVTGLDAASGAVLWETELDSVSGFALLDGEETLVAATVAYESDGAMPIGALVALNPLTGAERWRAALPGSPYMPPLVRDGVVVVVVSLPGSEPAGRAVGVRADDGTPLWDVALAGSSPQLYDVPGAIVVHDDSGALGLDPETGEIAWRGGRPGSPPGFAVAGSVMVLRYGGDHPTARQQLVALDPRDGRELWERESERPDTGMLAVSLAGDAERLFVVGF